MPADPNVSVKHSEQCLGTAAVTAGLGHQTDKHIPFQIADFKLVLKS